MWCTEGFKVFYAAMYNEGFIGHRSIFREAESSPTDRETYPIRMLRNCPHLPEFGDDIWFSFFEEMSEFFFKKARLNLRDAELITNPETLMAKVVAIKFGN